MPQISIIVPIYKVEDYLPRCIDSILRQSFSDFELILVDDGSPDSCGAICDEYAAKDSRICVIHQTNAKVSAARNAGIDIAKGEWLAFVDPDDWLHKDYLKILLSGALEDTDLVICDCLETSNFEEEDRECSQVAFFNASLDDLQANRIARTRPWGRIVRRRTVGALRYIPGTEPAEDSCFNELLFRSDMKFRITDVKIYYYYMRPDSAIHSHMGRGSLDTVSTLLELLKGIEDTEKRKRIIDRCYRSVLSARYGEKFSDDYSEVLKRCKNLFKELSVFLPELDLKDRLIFRTLTFNPFLYRAWRIHDDPTLLEFEKMQKQRRKKGSSE